MYLGGYHWHWSWTRLSRNLRISVLATIFRSILRAYIINGIRVDQEALDWIFLLLQSLKKFPIAKYWHFVHLTWLLAKSLSFVVFGIFHNKPSTVETKPLPGFARRYREKDLDWTIPPPPRGNVFPIKSQKIFYHGRLISIRMTRYLCVCFLPFNPFQVISGAVSYSNHTVPGQAS